MLCQLMVQIDIVGSRVHVACGSVRASFRYKYWINPLYAVKLCMEQGRKAYVRYNYVLIDNDIFTKIKALYNINFSCMSYMNSMLQLLYVCHVLTFVFVNT